MYKRQDMCCHELKRSLFTALDPVGIAFFAFGNPYRLDKSDADFLDVIHTDASHYGVGIPIGHVDFYPNGGRRVQPGCPKPSGFLAAEGE